MTFVVPFDGSGLADAALGRATELGDVLEEQVLAVSVVPKANAEYARERGWLGSEESFDFGTVVSHLEKQVQETCPDADVRIEVVDRYAPAGAIANRIRDVAREVDASMVFVGSDNAGRLVTSISSVGGPVAADDAYDVMIVRSSEADQRGWGP